MKEDKLTLQHKKLILKKLKILNNLANLNHEQLLRLNKKLAKIEPLHKKIVNIK